MLAKTAATRSHELLLKPHFTEKQTEHKQQTLGDCVCRWKEHLNLFLWPLVIVPHCLVLAMKCLPLTVAEKTLQERKHLLLTDLLFHIT